MTNPLLEKSDLPQFSKIKPEHIQPAIEQLIQECRKTTEQVLNQPNFSWENFCQPLAEVNERLSRAWSPVSHLNAVKNSPELREVYQACLPLLAEYGTWVGQHQGLYNAYLQLKNSAEFAHYSQAQKKAIENSLRDFELSGISLPAEQQKRYGEIVTRLSELNSQFSNNVLDATMGWEKIVTDENQLKGLPESALQAAKQSAQNKGVEGYRFTLEIPSYLPVMTYCENRQLREEMYRAFVTRASEQGPNAGKWDNSAVMEEILTLRVELAKLLGFEHYTDLSLATKMAENPQQVFDFLENLAVRCKPQGEKELAKLEEFCKTTENVTALEPWDITFYSEKQKQAQYSINDEELRPYFPEDRVLSGLFELIKRIFNIRAVERFGVDTWHKDVRFFDLLDETDEVRGSFYLDLYAREHKRGGVPWDAVELPSQFLENWCWEEQALAFISGHYETGEPLPKEKLTQLLKAKNFQAAMFVLRQLEFGLFDFRLHHNYQPNKADQILDQLKSVKQQVAVIKGVEWARTPHSFSHIFAGGYAAGYYSYLWAEVLSADAYSRFEEEGIFNPTTGKSFLDEILTRGGSEEPMALFERFRGRKPTLDALLRHKGIAN